MSKLDFDRDIKASTRFAEGFLNGLKLSICHAFTYGVYHAKELSKTNNTPFKTEYFKHISRSSLFYPLLMSTTYGQR
jgi:hypothetical protein